MPGSNCVSNWDFPVGTYKPSWNRWEIVAISQKENSHYIRPDLLKHLLSSNESNDRNQSVDHQHVFTEALLKELAKMAVSVIQPTQSRIPFPFFPQRNYNVDPATNLQIFGFRGYVCDKCLTPETYYVAFPNAEGQGGIQTVHFCDPARAAATSKLVDRFGVFSSLYDKIPTLVKQEVNSRTGNNNSLVALRLPSPQEEIIKLPNRANPSKPGIVFPYSKQRHLSLEPAKENKKLDKSNYAWHYSSQR